MFFLAVALYFIVVCCIGWLVLFPAGRERVQHGMAGLLLRLNGRTGRLARDAGLLKMAGAASVRRGALSLRRHYRLGLAGALLIGLPPLFAFLASEKVTLGGYAASTREVNPQVAGLLQGEQLVPPAELPPLVFATREVLQLRPMLVSASRNWTLLNPDYAQRLLLVFKIMKERHGYDMAILEGYRSPERQNLLAGMGGSVTNAAAFQSWHQYGLAADCAFLRDGKLVISEKDPWAMRGYQLYGETAESVGMTWGGRWKMMDFGHTELRLAGVMRK